MIRVGIAGIGYIAEEYIKLFSQGKIKNAELHALSSRNYAHMEEIKNTYHLTDATLFSDYNAMLASSGIDMVIVCTPHFCHPDMAIRSIERGIHTLIEKPVGVFPEELETLRLCCARHPDIRSGVLYCRRGNKAFIKLKELTDSGFIGEMKRVTWIVTDMYRPKAYFDAYPWKGTFREEGGGLLMTQVSHQNHHADRHTVCTNRDERVQTNGRLSYKIEMRGKHTTTHGEVSRRLLPEFKPVSESVLEPPFQAQISGASSPDTKDCINTC